MRTEFESLSDRSRIWVYQSKEKLDASTAKNILDEANTFLQQWAAHGADLMASVTIEYDRFLILATDENFNMASGCSIDSKVRFVQGLDQKYQLDLFDRTLLAFKKDERIEMHLMQEMKKLVESDYFTDKTYYFNNNIQTKGQLKSDWLVKPEESWLKKYFKPLKSV